jgi:RNA polymerase sigma-70 factor (ECF subfamily)
MLVPCAISDLLVLAEQTHTLPCEASSAMNGAKEACFMDNLDDLLISVASGDRPAFRELYRLTAPRLRAVVRALIRDPERSKEIIQDAYVRIWQNAAKFDRTKGTASAWLVTLTRRLAIDELRRRDLPVSSLDEDESLMNTLAADFVETEPLGMDRVSRCLGTLRDDYRRAILLTYVHGYTYDQLSQRFDRPVGTVKTWVHRGLADLRACIG